MSTDNFDWVTVVSSCVISSAFEHLKLQVFADVRTRNAQLSAKKAAYSFRFIGNGASFSVATEASGVSGRAIKFKLTDAAITVVNANDDLMFDVGLTLSENGECRYLINGQEKESWHLRKMALESLFFRSPWEQ